MGASLGMGKGPGQQWPVHTGLFFVGALMVVAAIGLFIFYLVSRSAHQATYEWPMVTGRIESCSVGTVRATRTGHRPYVFLEYSYEVSGMGKFTGKELSLRGNTFISEQDALAKAAQYKPGTQVWVYYDPKRPANAILELGDASRLAWIGAAFGTLSALVIAGGVLVSRRAQDATRLRGG